MKSWSVFAGVAGTLTLSIARPSSSPAAPANPACALVTVAEVEAALGGKVTGLNNAPSGVPDDAQVCTGTIPGATIGLRLIPQLSQATVDARKKLVDLMLQMGAHVEMNTDGPISCQAVTPPPAMVASTGFETSCSVSKSPKLATIEIGTKTQTAMVPIAKLRLLAVKMLGRL
jgi:hypothetical protein